jgi:hypothetical protein
MRKTFAIFAVVFTCWLAAPIKSEAQDKESLRFVQAIPLPNVKGRLDLRSGYSCGSLRVDFECSPGKRHRARANVPDAGNVVESITRNPAW